MFIEATSGLSIFVVLFAALMWGSWFVCLKHLGKYPLDAFFLTLILVSFLFVWALSLAMDGQSIFLSYVAVYSRDPLRVFVPCISGFVFTLGMRFSIMAQYKVGLSIAQPIQSSTILFFGTWVSGSIGGIPEGLSWMGLIAACGLLVGAVICGLIAGMYCVSDDPGTNISHNRIRISTRAMWQAFGLMLLSGFMIPAYTVGLSYSLRSPTQPLGFSVFPCMSLIVTGSLAAAVLSSGIYLTQKRLWSDVLKFPRSVHGLGCISGVCHYSGNVLHAIASTNLSTVVSWPLGLTSGLWTQVWGLIYGEFRGAPRTAYIFLFLAIILYLGGAFVIGRVLL